MKSRKGWANKVKRLTCKEVQLHIRWIPLMQRCCSVKLQKNENWFVTLSLGHVFMVFSMSEFDVENRQRMSARRSIGWWIVVAYWGLDVLDDACLCGALCCGVSPWNKNSRTCLSSNWPPNQNRVRPIWWTRSTPISKGYAVQGTNDPWIVYVCGERKGNERGFGTMITSVWREY